MRNKVKNSQNMQIYKLSARDDDVQKSYDEALLKLAGRCPFCHLVEYDHKIIRHEEYFYIIENRFPYAIWENRRVEKHLLLLPKKHTIALADLPRNALEEYLKLLVEYGANGHSVYTRSADNPARSQRHHHTHMIKINSSEADLI